MVLSRGHIVESWRAELEKPSSISEFATWSFDTFHHRNDDMRICETPFGVSCGHHRWSYEREELARS
jgi:hypothetical protein